MSMSESKVITIGLDNEKEIKIQATKLGELVKNEYPVEERVGAIPSIKDFNKVCDSIEAFASSLNTTISKVKPTKATVEFGLNIGVDNSNNISALIVSGNAEANLKISLEWENK